MALLESSTAEWLTPQDWYTLVKAVLSGGDFFGNQNIMMHVRKQLNATYGLIMDGHLML